MPAEAPPAEEKAWEFSTSVFYSDPPGAGDHVTAILYGQRGPLHLELRYGYEDLDTASLFAGWTFGLGEEEGVAAELTPMLGVVAGETNGIAPGLEVDVSWRRLAWYAEAEYVLDTDDSDDDYLYCWSTLTYGVTDWLSAGLVTERTKLVDTDFEVQHGLALEFAFERVSCALYAYNLGTDDDYAVVSLGFSF